MTAGEGGAASPSYDVVVPTVGRPSLATLLEALAASAGPPPGRVLVVDDRRGAASPLLPAGPPPALADRVEILRGKGAGPASARNIGWRASRAEWIAFLDDDVVPASGWASCLASDLIGLGPDVAGSQGRVHVPLPVHRRPTDWERNVKGLEQGLWITADMACRRSALLAVGGFDERFPRAYREDLDLAIRLFRAGFRIVRGGRCVTHPVTATGRWVSVRLQRGNADDALMSALHGPGWRRGHPPGRRPRHMAITAAGLLALAGLALRRRRVAAAGLAGWVAGTAELAWARISPGPRTADEVVTMLVTSAVIPAVATYHWLAGVARQGRLLRDTARAPRARSAASLPDAVLLDRDGTIVVDVPYNDDPDRVAAVAGAREALDRLRSAGVRLAVVSNQSGIARGLLTRAQLETVNRRVEALLGPLGPWLVCPHRPEEGCECRKPSPGLILRAAAALGVDPSRCVVIGDTGADVEAARAAGARAILVPNAATRAEEIESAPLVARDLDEAVDMVLGPE